MNRLYCWLLILLGFILLGCEKEDPSFIRKRDEVSRALKQIPNSKIKLVLYSLNPDDPRELPESSDEGFHRYPILGSAEITSNDEKKSLFDAFAKGVEETHGGDAPACFNPRHGLRTISGTTTNDFLICFECISVETFGFEPAQSFLISTSPEAAFDKARENHHLKKATKPARK